MTSETTGAADGDLAVEVAYALPHKQLIIPLRVPLGTTAVEAVRMSAIATHFDELVEGDNKLGIFGAKVAPDHVLQDGDRVEIYRPLLADPKEVRRQLAKLGKTMGKGGGNASG